MTPRPIRRKRLRETVTICAVAGAFVAVFAAGFSMPLWIARVPLVVKPVVFVERWG